MIDNMIYKNLDNFDRSLLLLIFSLILKYNIKKVDRLNIAELNEFILECEYFSSREEYENLKSKISYKELKSFAMECLQNDLINFHSYESNFLKRKIFRSNKIIADINFNNDLLIALISMNHANQLVA